MASSPLSISPPGEPLACKNCGSVIEPGSNFCPACGLSAQAESVPDPLVGRVVADRYRITQLLGRGGMGVVYRCEHARMGKVMAIKLLHGDLARDQEVQRRFRREAQAASRLSHPNTVSIFDFGTSDGLMYLVMEFVNGEDLGRVLRTAHHVPSTRAAAIAAQACGSLAEAHDNGIVHRDLKPENLLIAKLKDGRDLVKLLDFGLAKLREGEDRNEVTSAGTLVGTPYYMAPEIIRGHAVDHRADVYALGAVIYRTVTGTPPYTGTSPVAVLTKHLTDELVPPSRRRPDLEIPATIDEIVARCMQKEPSARYASIDEVRTALTDYLTQEGLADSLLRESGLTARHAVVASTDSKPTVTPPKLVVATRNDVEAFERRLRRGRYLMGSTGVAIVLAASIAGAFVWRAQAGLRSGPRDAESEPNNTPDQATLIGPNTTVRGRVGERVAVDRGDVDFYRLVPLPSGESRLRVELNPQPNIDTVVELLRAGEPRAVAIADDGPAGARQVIAGFRVSGASAYYLSVHERLGTSRVPSENVTDRYSIRYSIGRITADLETEPDDNEEIAMSVDVGRTVHGYWESRDDVDYWCMERQASAFRATLVAPEGVDLELIAHPRDGSAETVADSARAGGREHVEVSAPADGGRGACLVVRGSQTGAADVTAEPDHPYTLEVSLR